MTDTASIVTSLLGAAGAGAILLELTKRALDALSGRGRKRRDEVDRAWQAADKARCDRDREASKRRIYQEYSSKLVRMLIAAPCVDPADIPPHPNTPTTGPVTQEGT